MKHISINVVVQTMCGISYLSQRIESLWIANGVFKSKLGEKRSCGAIQSMRSRSGLFTETRNWLWKTFSPFCVLCTVIALAIHGDTKLHQMDIKTAFMNRELSEQVYMKQPKGFLKEEKENLMCHLKKSIYGLETVTTFMECCPQQPPSRNGVCSDQRRSLYLCV